MFSEKLIQPSHFLPIILLCLLLQIAPGVATGQNLFQKKSPSQDSSLILADHALGKIRQFLNIGISGSGTNDCACAYVKIIVTADLQNLERINLRFMQS